MRKLYAVGLSFIGFCSFLTMWELLHDFINSPAVPSEKDIFFSLGKLLFSQEYLSHIVASLQIILSGILTGIVFGIVTGTLIFQHKSIRYMIMPIIECIRGVSALTLFPLLIVVAGIGIIPRVFIIFWTSFPAILISTIQSLEVDKDVISAAELDGADGEKILFKIRFPIALSEIMTGIRIGVGGGWISLVASEMLGATKGLGYFLLNSAQTFRFSEVYATIICIAVIGGLMNLGLLIIQEKIRKEIDI